jgi:serine/threonine-protein kinase
MIYRYTLGLSVVLAATAVGALAADNYGAIAFSPSTHGHGYAYGFSTEEAAQQAAINECEKYSRGGDCMSVVATAQSCAALAVGSNAYGSAAAASAETARAGAIRNCETAGGRNCWVVRWLCH